ncbi:hypothetical protein [Fulvimarina sp. MAC3]|uniref:hypothetical protein n=1 Tax=Fulvimarina sp. MAC3 TaxID=3148887 RepID=UPI0031FD979C
MKHDKQLHNAAFEHKLLLLLLNNADVEPVILNDYGLKGSRLTVTVPNEVLGYLELVGSDEEDDEEQESGYGDVEGMLLEERGEPALGWTEEFDQELARTIEGGGYGDGEGEPSLGWAENHGCGFTQAQAEAARDDREDDVDFEIDHGDQPEHDPAEDGVADSDGVAEQFGGIWFHAFGVIGSTLHHGEAI